MEKNITGNLTTLLPDYCLAEASKVFINMTGCYNGVVDGISYETNGLNPGITILVTRCCITTTGLDQFMYNLYRVVPRKAHDFLTVKLLNCIIVVNAAYWEGKPVELSCCIELEECVVTPSPAATRLLSATPFELCRHCINKVLREAHKQQNPQIYLSEYGLMFGSISAKSPDKLTICKKAGFYFVPDFPDKLATVSKGNYPKFIENKLNIDRGGR